MTNEITSTHDMAEQAWDGRSEPAEVETDIVATKEAERKGIEFHVSMRDYTMDDMEALIIDAAARMIVGNHRETPLKKMIEEQAMALIVDLANSRLAGVAAEIIDQPLTPSFGDKKPVTMREYIGLTGQAYLTEAVDPNSGERNSSSWNNTKIPRIAFLVHQAMDAKFKKEIEQATNFAIREIHAAIGAEYKKFIEAEKARVRAALDAVTA